MQPWKRSSLATRAMSSLTELIIAALDRPVREYWTDSTRTAKTNNSTSNAEPLTALEPVKEGWDHGINVDKYKIKRKTFQEKQEARNDNGAKCYYLFLSHCPNELETEIRNSSMWTAHEEDQDVISLLLMVRDITHNKKERKESVVTFVKSNVELFKTVQEQDQDLDDYYEVFKAQVDTTDAHGGSAGYHLVVYQLYLAALRAKKNTTNAAWDGMTSDDKKAVTGELSRQASRPTWPACSSSW